MPQHVLLGLTSVLPCGSCVSHLLRTPNTIRPYGSALPLALDSVPPVYSQKERSPFFPRYSDILQRDRFEKLSDPFLTAIKGRWVQSSIHLEQRVCDPGNFSAGTQKHCAAQDGGNAGDMACLRRKVQAAFSPGTLTENLCSLAQQVHHALHMPGGGVGG